MWCSAQTLGHERSVLTILGNEEGESRIQSVGIVSMGSEEEMKLELVAYLEITGEYLIVG